MSFVRYSSKTAQKNKKKPPPRPPPPNLAKYKSKSSYNLNLQNENLIEWSPPNSPTVERTHTFGGSVSSSFSSSTSSLASSKKSFESDLPITNSLWPVNFNSGYHTRQANAPITNNSVQQAWQHGKINGGSGSASVPSQFISLPKQNGGSKIIVPSIFGPTIIRAQVPKNKVPDEPKKNDSNPPSPPMPSVPPPSPPKDSATTDVPFGVALYNYSGTDPGDLSFQANEVIVLLKRINDDWLYGRVLDKEGMFPANFIEIQVPLTENNKVLALYEFCPQMAGDLALKPGQSVTVLRKINDDWLYGEANGQRGQFPSNFVETVPNI